MEELPRALREIRPDEMSYEILSPYIGGSIRFEDGTERKIGPQIRTDPEGATIPVVLPNGDTEHLRLEYCNYHVRSSGDTLYCDALHDDAAFLLLKRPA